MTDEDKNRLPLPFGCSSAQYLGDMREVAQYNILRDDTSVRYDWIEDGQKKTAWGKPIDGRAAAGEIEFEMALAERRATCLKDRGI